MLNLYGEVFHNALILGSARFPSLKILVDAIKQSHVEIVTISLRRESMGDGSGQRFWQMIKDLGIKVLPNTAGCYSVREAIATAHMAREFFGTDWIKLEVIADEKTLQPNVLGLVEASRILMDEGFKVFPYMTEDLSVADKLVEMGVKILMPWGAPIGSGQGLLNPKGLLNLRNRYPQITMIVDAGIGSPSHAVYAGELGYDGILVNTAVALSEDPVHMAMVFAEAIKLGRKAKTSGLMAPRDVAEASTPLLGQPFWKYDSHYET